MQRLLRQVVFATVDLGRPLPGIDLHPHDLALVAVGVFYGRVDDF